MARFKRFLLAIVVAVGVGNFSHLVFLPPASQRVQHAGTTASVAVGASALLGAAPVHATMGTELDDSARALALAAYPLAKSIDWTNTPVLTQYMAQGTGNNKEALIAVLDAALYMNPKLISAAVLAHKNAIDAADGKLLTPERNFIEVTTALAEMLASAPEKKVHAIFQAVPNLPDINAEWLTQLSADDAQSAYTAFLATAEAVKKTR